MPRLDALLARNLGMPRGQARQMLDAGQVRPVLPATDGGESDWTARTSIEPDRLPVRVRIGVDREIVLFDRVDLALHKPLGCVTALRDVRHPVAYALLRGAPLFPELRPVGRLDLDTSGLLLWSTDGGWIQRLSHPKRAVPRTYHAALARPFQPPDQTLVLDDGHVPHLADLRPVEPAGLHPALAQPPEATCFASITLTGGAYHEVRRIFAALGSHVLSLCRISMGAYRLPDDLAPGEYRLIQPAEVIA